MVIRTLLVLFLVFSLFVGSASANYNYSGSITYSAGSSNSYNSISASSIASGPISTTQFWHRFTDAKEINHVIFKKTWQSSLGYTKNDVVPFTATVDGTYYGSGLVSIVEQTDNDIWFDIDFTSVDESYASSLTGSKLVVLSYASSVWSGVSTISYSLLYFNYGPGGALTATAPTCMYALTDGTLCCLDAVTNTVFSSWSTSYKNDYDYYFNSTLNTSRLDIDKLASSSIWSVYDSNDDLYFEDSGYSVVDIDQTFVRDTGVYGNITFNTGNGTSVLRTFDLNGTVSDSDDEEEGEFEYNITTELDEYSPGDTVNVTFTTDQKGTIQVVKTISNDIYHSIGFVSGATNATWQFYIAGNEPYGFYDVHLLDSSNTILATVRYALLPSTSSLDILQSSVDLHETFVVFAQTVNASILSIEDPDGVEVWNESIDALMYDYIYYTPTVKTGIYTAYLYDDGTLNDTVMVYLADPPIIDDPLDPETNGTIPIEDVLEDDETMTEYFDDKFREFAPTAWGIFLLSVVLWLMAILSSFGGSNKRR